ncbi:hypothetical protein L1887_41814 [Cichorium endivia]|nr:hypothetical protein L1887_41814 [Cichorium endivia]
MLQSTTNIAEIIAETNQILLRGTYRRKLKMEKWSTREKRAQMQSLRRDPGKGGDRQYHRHGTGRDRSRLRSRARTPFPAPKQQDQLNKEANRVKSLSGSPDHAG